MEIELKLKVGESGKIISKKCGHGFDIGEIVTVSELCLPPKSIKQHYEVKNEFGDRWWVEEDEIEKLINQENESI